MDYFFINKTAVTLFYKSYTSPLQHAMSTDTILANTLVDCVGV